MIAHFLANLGQGLKAGYNCSMRKMLSLIAAALLGVLCLSKVVTAKASPRTVFTYDARPLRTLDWKQPQNARTSWDTIHVLSALQGLSNRRAPRFYLFYCQEFGVDTDQFWMNWARNEDPWLQKSRIVPLATIESALRQFRGDYKGLVVYDEKVPATSAIASTIAGVENLLPIRYDKTPGSLYLRLTQGLKIPIRRRLIHADGTSLFTGKGTIPEINQPTSGSAKIDAYRWAIAKYLDTDLTDAHYAAYYVDAFWFNLPQNGGPDLHTLSNHDYFIARRAFFFDLSPWADEAPNDDPQQKLGGDRETLLRILRALYKEANGDIVKIGGFPPWPYKYTTHTGGKHGGVETEWEFTKFISQFNAYHEADAAGLGAMANASLWQHYPLKKHYAQPNPRPNLADWKAKGYILPDGSVARKSFVAHYVGDYDAPPWLYKAVPAFFPDKTRGQVPLGWAFGPTLSDRAPQAFVYAYQHATPNDFFISADSGAGYLNARALNVRPDSGLPSGMNKWVAHNQKYFGLWDMDITGFILDGAGGASTDEEFAAYKKFSPKGFGTHYEKGPALHVGVPSIPERDLPDDVQEAAARVANDAKGSDEKANFQWRRSILKAPDWYARLSQILAEKYPESRVEVVDPYTLFGLIEYQLKREGK